MFESLNMMERERNADVETDRKLGAQLSEKGNALSCLMRTGLQAAKVKKDQKSETLERDLKRIPELEKEKRFEKTILQGSLHKILLQEAAQCIRIQPWDDEPDHIVEIEFPKMAVLGERQLGIEIMKTKNLEFENKQLLTDVVQITQSSHASFLRPVTVRIPLHQKYKKKWEGTEETDKHERKIKIENGIAQFTSFVFSPAGLYYDEIEQVVHALVLGDEIDQMLHRRSVYMIVEQEINIETPALRISLAPFFSFPEHESCRVAKNVFFCPFPVAAESFDNVVISLEWDENFITSVNGNLEKDLIFPIGQLNEHQWWTGHRLQYEFNDGTTHDTNLTVRHDHFKKSVPLLNMADLVRLRESAERFIPSQGDIFSCLNSIPENYGWLKFIQDCLNIDKMNFCDFVYKDVLDTNRNRDPNPPLDELAIQTIFERHKQNLTIEHFKSEVFRVSSDRLTDDNLDQLAEALRYVEENKLREGLRTGLETHSINLNGTSRKFQEWVEDGDGGIEFRSADETPTPKEKQVEETTLQGSLHKIRPQEAEQCIRVQPWDDEPDHIVEIDFPEMAVLGERQLGIEIMKTKDLEFENKQVMTTAIQITQPSRASFLRPVTVKVPLNHKYKNWERTERTDRYGGKIQIENGMYYDEIEHVVDVLIPGDEYDQMRHRGGVYLIVEQEINIKTPALKISLKPFFSFQEYEKCRAARNIFFSAVNAEELSGTITFKLEWDPNFIAKVNESLEKDLKFKIGRLKARQSWSGKKRLRYEFQEEHTHDTNLKVMFSNDEKNFQLLNMAEFVSLRESAERFIPSRRDLYLCLNSIPERFGWLNFMQDCLGIDKMNFREFVYKDVLDTNRNRDPNLQFDKSDIETIFERHMQNLTIEHFKREVFRVLSDRLTNENLDKLAEALRYVDGSRLRDALRNGLEKQFIDLNGTSTRFREWVGDGTGEAHIVPSDTL